MNNHAHTRPYSKQQDEELLLAVARGDRHALDALYVGYHRRLTRFLSRITPHYAMAEEVINDTFLVVWQRAKDFRGAARVSGWIIGIAYRIALQSLRRNDGRRRAPSSENLPENSMEASQDAEFREWMARGLNEVSLEQRLTLELVYHLGHSIEEIAEISQCTADTVKDRMCQARETMRRSKSP